ncbi:efflux RND transporter permease subunit [Algicola sagamiensis]|uniref:efflux RND transporter permease subunit n=1 Tax=Algicola sagamiensis TaxID=163869 RepID=UPI00037E5740|nr:efflux RND transporter permease subunit [Algicola sagamiensis]
MQDTSKGIIAWFARNPVAANLLMIFIIVSGLATSFTIQKRSFPPATEKKIEIEVNYPGASPQEIEEGIIKKFESALESVKGLERVVAFTRRGWVWFNITVEQDQDLTEVTNEVKAQIDAISNLPDGMEKPEITQIKHMEDVIDIAVHGNADFRTLKKTGQKIVDDLRQLTGAPISYWSGPDYEISIEIQKDKLREYGLTFSQVAQAIRNFSTNASAGNVKTDNGYVNVRIENLAMDQQTFEMIPALSREDGSQILLSDVATVVDGFEDWKHFVRFDGENAVSISVNGYEDQDSVKIADQVKQYLETHQHELPEGVKATQWLDITYYLKGRLDMMMENLLSGAVLVFLILALFLRVRLAFWVMMGLPICFFGTLMLMPTSWISVTVNLTSLFGFILVLGIVVDDAIVIGESAASEIEKSGYGTQPVIRGVKRVAVPTVFGILTTVVAFFPMLFGDGPDSSMQYSISVVVVLCLLFSLVESKLILPAHLAQMKARKEDPNHPLVRMRSKFDQHLKNLIQKRYQPFLALAIEYRYAVFSFFGVMIMLCMALYFGGLLRFVGMPKIPHDFPSIVLSMKEEATDEATIDAILAIENVILKVEKDLVEEFGYSPIKSYFYYKRGRNGAKFRIQLNNINTYPIDTFVIASRWRDEMPVIPGMQSIQVIDSVMGGEGRRKDIGFRLVSDNELQLAQATVLLKQALGEYQGVGDLEDSLSRNTQEVQIDLKPFANSVGLTERDIARQMSASFYGMEAQRILRDGEEVKVMLRYPKQERDAISKLDDMVIRVPNGEQVPLSELAELTLKPGIGRIRREAGKRTVYISASVDKTQQEPFKLAQDIRSQVIPKLLKQFPDVATKVDGKLKDEQEELLRSLRNMLMVFLAIYALLAIPLKSYSQPLIVMSAIPFGVVGAILGHLILGMDLSMFSIFGIIAAIGVVVNDSLVLVDYVNQRRAEGLAIRDAVIEAGGARFRAIILTSLTTFIGLAPIMMETSLQAKFVIPMAVSLAFGILFSTVITLVLIPCLYLLLDDIRQLGRRLFVSQHTEVAS